VPLEILRGGVVAFVPVLGQKGNDLLGLLGFADEVESADEFLIGNRLPFGDMEEETMGTDE
jgi:hypothetical protein